MFDPSNLDDNVTVSGLSVLLDEEERVPFLELRLSCLGRVYRASILVADDEWALRLREEGGIHLPDADTVYARQCDAILGAMLRVLEAGSRSL